ncbi:arsenate reductase (glutaredoxin) [Halomonas garicola]|uniref:arsenate reductase (glutaredoxin) n=1 Tax=Halomonas garicola TaxID=1690008 RepID=UPI0040517743
MDKTHTLDVLAALSQPTRLDAFRLLMRHEPDGLSAGEIARQQGVPHNTMSAHLATLQRAGLVTSRRQSRSIIYRARLESLNETLTFLLQDCCAGAPERCALPAAPLDLQGGSPMTSVIYHNPACGTSRNTLSMMRQSGEEPHVIEYLKTPPSRQKLVELIAAMQIAPRELLRGKDAPRVELKLDDPALDDDALIDVMLEHPLLINRPIVVTPKGTRLCRPSEAVLTLLATPVASFTKENGETVCLDDANR